VPNNSRDERQTARETRSSLAMRDENTAWDAPHRARASSARSSTSRATAFATAGGGGATTTTTMGPGGPRSPGMKTVATREFRFDFDDARRGVPGVPGDRASATARARALSAIGTRAQVRPGRRRDGARRARAARVPALDSVNGKH